MTGIVLVVDDEKDLADAYARSLSDQFETLVAYNGQEALEKINDDVDVVLLDRKMPQISGDDVLEEIRERLGYKCSIVMVTAVEPDFDVVSMDFDGYVIKPVSGGELHEVVQKMIERTKLTDEERELYSLREKFETLRKEKSKEELESSEEFSKLREILEEESESVSFEDIDEENIQDALEEM